MVAGILLDAIWPWFLAAAVLMILELAVPGAFMLWFGLAAAAITVAPIILASCRQAILLTSFSPIFRYMQSPQQGVNRKMTSR